MCHVHEVWGDRDRLLAMQRFRDAFLEGGFTLEAFQEIFCMFDEECQYGYNRDLNRNFQQIYFQTDF